MPRDDFKRAVVERLAKRVGMRCSNPDCRQLTSGPDSGAGIVNIGVAAHISGAAPGGARYDPDMSSEERSGIANGIWLCQTDAKMIDDDEFRYSASLLREWRETAEHMAALEQQGYVICRRRSFGELEEKMPELFREMRMDLNEHPFGRDIFLRRKKLSYNDSGKFKFIYFHEDHDNLTEKFVIMRNYGAVFDRRSGTLDQFEITEDFVDFVLKK